MDRAEIERTYSVVNGRITSPGKYQGEPVWAPYFGEGEYADAEDHYPQCTHTHAEIDQGRCDCEPWGCFHISEDEREMFAPYLDGVETVWLWTDSQGFVVIKTNTDEATLRRDYHGITD